MFKVLKYYIYYDIIKSISGLFLSMNNNILYPFAPLEFWLLRMNHINGAQIVYSYESWQGDCFPIFDKVLSSNYFQLNLYVHCQANINHFLVGILSNQAWAQA